MRHTEIKIEVAFKLEEGGVMSLRGIVMDNEVISFDEKEGTIQLDREGDSSFGQQFSLQENLKTFFPIRDTNDLTAKVIIPLSEGLNQILMNRTDFLMKLKKKASEDDLSEEVQD